jgi:hypothetical protein
LERYHEHNPKANLLFLTLNGELPSDWTNNIIYNTEPFKKVFQSVSYRANIMRWLESCRKEAATAPGVREVITQYIHLIQRLTQQNTSARMNQEIIKAVTQDTTGETYLAYAYMRNADLEIRKAIIAKLREQLQAIGQELGLEMDLEYELSGLGNKYEGCLFTTPALKGNNLKFGIQCDGSNYRDFYFGFAYIVPARNDPALKNPLTSRIVEFFKAKFRVEPPTDNWPVSAWCDHRNWTDETMAAILSGDFAKSLKTLIESLNEIATKGLKG